MTANLIVLTVFAFGAHETKVLLEEMNNSMVDLTGQTAFLREQFDIAGAKIETIKKTQMFKKTNSMLEAIYSEEATNATMMLYGLLQAADAAAHKLAEYPEPIKAISSVLDMLNTILSSNSLMLDDLRGKLPKIVNSTNIIVDEVAALIAAGALIDIRTTITNGLNFTSVGLGLLEQFSKNKKITLAM